MSHDENELWEVLQSVHDEESFLQFLLALRDDREASIEREKVNPSPPFGPEAGGWENTTIEVFCDAAVAWARSSAHGTRYKRPDNPWRRCADILYAGKIYE